MSRQFMLLPSMACQANCTYCFGPNRGPVMTQRVFEAAIEWIDSISGKEESIDLTFHGGEPLLAGTAWYARNLPLLARRFGKRLKLSMQSNLWALDDAFCELLRAYNVSLGTSLDGPRQINDRQRGEGYFRRTMAGIDVARRHGLEVGAICTFTQLSAPHYRQVLDFFISERLPFSVHAAVSTLGCNQQNSWAMCPKAHADLFVRLFDAYMENVTRIRISTFDAMAKGISTGKGGLCTFTNCLGDYLTIGPRGKLYSCNRFAAHPEWALGSVLEMPDLDALRRSQAWNRLQEREAAVRRECGDCPHFAYCRGGCAYNAVTSDADPCDPHCVAYKRLYSHITDLALEEIFADQNLDAVVAKGLGRHGLLRKGRLLQIMRDGPHPQEVTRRARELVAAVALGDSGSPEGALHKLDRAGLITCPELALQSLTTLRHRLDNQSQEGLANAYLHITYTCNLSCAHCYAHSGPGKSPLMAVDEVVRLVHDAASAGFAKTVITGGEPTVHPQIDVLLDVLAELRQRVKPMQTVLRTNLVLDLPPELAERLAHSTDQVVVSVDGDRASHDARRGAGTYDRVVDNLEKLVAVNPTTRVGITAVLTAEQMDGREGDAVRTLGDELSVWVRLRSVLPLGRGANLELAPAFYSSLEDDAEIVAYSARPVATCGLGMNLYIGPRGESYPCYALLDARHALGNALKDGLQTVLGRNDRYRQITVDSNVRCHHCALRYLCGGFCRAWCRSLDPNDMSVDCRALHDRARGLLESALEALDIPTDRWVLAGLPLPEHLADELVGV